jgi:hypothetical protein
MSKGVARFGIVALACCAIVAYAGRAHAGGNVAYHTVNFTMSGAQEVPSNGSPGVASGTIEVDTLANTITYSIAFSGLSGTPFAAHFHGPAAPGFNAGIKIGIGVATNPIVGTQSYNPADEADILAGRWYVNIHTSPNFAGGEIRGQVILQPIPGIGQQALTALVVLLLATGGLFVVRRRTLMA